MTPKWWAEKARGIELIPIYGNTVFQEGPYARLSAFHYSFCGFSLTLAAATFNNRTIEGKEWQVWDQDRHFKCHSICQGLAAVKAAVMGDVTAYHSIVESGSTAYVRRVSRNVKGFSQEIWGEVALNT